VRLPRRMLTGKIVAGLAKPDYEDGYWDYLGVPLGMIAKEGNNEHMSLLLAAVYAHVSSKRRK